MAKEELVDLVLNLACQVEQLKQEIEKLKLSRDLDSSLSSKPPSSDLLKRPETVKEEQGQPEPVKKNQEGNQDIKAKREKDLVGLTDMKSYCQKHVPAVAAENLGRA